MALSIFRIVQEALTNIARHSGAERAVVKLEYKENSINLYIKDYGTGIDPEKINSAYSTGLTGMKERALSNNGTLVIKSVIGQGTVVSATFRL
jgi:signal transduction histidine kinase